MTTNETRGSLCRAFGEVTSSLMGLFDLHDADPELVEAVADTLGKVFRAQLKEGGEPPKCTCGREAMERLFDEIVAAEVAATSETQTEGDRS